MRIGSLFSGYGGLDMAVSSVLGGSVAWHVEYDKAPSRILAHHYPTVPNYGDVTAVDFTTIEPVDVLTGGYPCQPFSHAGLRKGTNDERHLWPHVLRAIREMGPRLVVLENVRGHLTLGFDVVLADLASVGWSARWGIVRASDAGACHQRARLFIVAYPQREGRQGQPVSGLVGAGIATSERSDLGYPEGAERRATEPEHLRAALGPAPEPRERPRVTAHASGQRHGAGQNSQGLGRLDRQDGGSPRQRQRPREIAGDRGRTDWGDYGPAIARWEHVIGRPAPAPTEPGRTGTPRLDPRFVEWMMGLPDGHVTDPAIGISRNDQLKALGNGVVPQQAALALRHLLAA